MLHIDELFESTPVTSHLRGVLGIDFDSDMCYLSEGITTVPLSAYVLLYVTQGRLCYQLDGRECQLEARNLVLYAPWTQLSILSKSDDFHGHQLFCDQAIFDRLVMENGGDVGFLQSRKEFPVVVLTSRQQTDITAFLQLMMSAIAETQHYRVQIVMGLMRSIQLYIVELHSAFIDVLSLTSERERLYRDFMKLAVEHYQHERKLSFYARHLCISTTYLSRIVREVSGQTVKNVLKNMLVTEAGYRLRNTAQSVSEISYHLGFEDQSAFTHFFRKHVGQSPLQYRAFK